MARKSTDTLDKNQANDPSIGERKRKHESTRGSRRAATKSKYFEPDTENESEGGEAPEDESSSAVMESEDDSDVLSEEVSEDEQRPKKRKAPGSSKEVESAPTPGSKGKELWRQGVSTGLAPGTQVIIKRPKPRTPGKVPYSDITIHPNTMLFLKDLKANNDREWLKSKCLPTPRLSFTIHLVPIPRILSRNTVFPHNCLHVDTNQNIACSFTHNDCGRSIHSYAK
jgi:hypothetical protein